MFSYSGWTEERTESLIRCGLGNLIGSSRLIRTNSCLTLRRLYSNPTYGRNLVLTYLFYLSFRLLSFVLTLWHAVLRYVALAISLESFLGSSFLNLFWCSNVSTCVGTHTLDTVSLFLTTWQLWQLRDMMSTDCTDFYTYFHFWKKTFRVDNSHNFLNQIYPFGGNLRKPGNLYFRPTDRPTGSRGIKIQPQ